MQVKVLNKHIVVVAENLNQDIPVSKKQNTTVAVLERKWATVQVTRGRVLFECEGKNWVSTCMFPDVHLLLDFKTPKFAKYDGYGDPIAHLKRYCNQLRGARRNEELLIAYFGESLTGVASEWFMNQDISRWYVWDDMTQDFVKQFQYNIDIAPNRSSLSNLKKKPSESFREYAIKWIEQASRVKPPMDDHELITVFLQVQEPDYFENMMCGVGKSFSEAIKMGEMVENGLKTGIIISQASLKAATQAVQIESGDTNEKVEEIMMTSRSRRGPRRTSRRYEQPP
ncbi:uncharacterized protein [Nicotiana sylvestris]|uniref:uncharacterized protein n=1 Tax=Nicotiana sylvestris TaxID=4096 RepID=UPI00388CE25F